jgi:hypothetical protein
MEVGQIGQSGMCVLLHVVVVYKKGQGLVQILHHYMAEQIVLDL